MATQVIELDSEFIQRLNKADEALDKLVQTTDSLSKQFDKLANGGLSRVVNMIDGMIGAIDKLAAKEVGDLGLQKVNNVASQAVDSINEVSKAVLDQSKAANANIDLSEPLERMYSKIISLQSEIDQFKAWESGNLIKTEDYAYIGGVADELNRLMAAYEALDNASKNLADKDGLFKDYMDDLNGVSISAQKASYELKRLSEFFAQEEKDSAIAAKNAAKEEERMLKAYEKRQKLYETLWKEMEHKENTTYKGAMDFSKNAQSINEQIQAIKYLKEARLKLNKDSFKGESEYRQAVRNLTMEINKQQKSVDGLIAKNSELQRSNDALMNTAHKLRNALSLMFSVHALHGYVNQLMSVRGELELQQRSLQALLKDKAEANKLWNQTVKLAVQSPFQIKELITYTKQLAAYRVETGKLHETTKMLADISAGLGVDMSRLILAYGQVKAANYLRGTELRQFSEAGINILEELATHFTTLEGTAVSVGEVFERVSKRMVSFEDVETVLKKVTSAGGTFYRMQEEQAETLRGQISNLKDSIAVMLNDIGEVNDGILKDSIGFVRSLVDNWRSVAAVLTTIISLLGLAKLHAILTSEKLILMAIDMKVLGDKIPEMLTLTEALKTGFKKIGESIKSATKEMRKFISANPAVLALAAALAVATSALIDYLSYREELEEINKKYRELYNTVRDLSIAFNDAFNKDYLDEARKQLKNLIDLANNEYKLGISIVAMDKLDAEAIKESFISIRDEIFDMQIFAKEMEKEFARRDIGVINFFSYSGRNPIKNLNKFGEDAEELFSHLRDETKDVAYAIQEAGLTLTESQQAALEDIMKPMGTEETKLQYIERIRSAYEKMSPVLSDLSVDVMDFDRYLRKNMQLMIDFGSIFKRLEDDIKWWWSDEKKKKAIKFAIDDTALALGLDETETEILYWAANKRFEVNITPVLNTDEDEKVFAKWQETYNSKIEGLKGFTKITDPEKTRDDIESELREILTANKSVLDAISSIGVEKATGEGGAYEGIDVDEIEQKAAQTQSLLDWLKGETKETTNDIKRSQKDWVNEVVKAVTSAHTDYISLIEDLDAMSAKSLALAKNTDVFNEAVSHVSTFGEINLGELNFETEQGTIDALSMLRDLLPASAHETRLAIEKEIGNIRGELAISESRDSQKHIEAEIEKMFTGYELSIELGELNVPRDWAKALFDIDTFDLSEIRNKILEERSAIEATGGNQALYESLGEMLSRVEEMEVESHQRRLKTYIEYARDSVGERAKIKLEEMKKLQEIELAFATSPKDSEETIAIKQSAKQQAVAKVQEDSYQNMRQFEWEEFQKSDTFIRIFDDLDNASVELTNHMIAKLQDFKDEWRNMPLEDMNAIVDKINELELHLMKSNPFKAAAEYRRELKQDGRSVDDIESETVEKIKEVDTAQQEIADLTTILQLKREGQALQALQYAGGKNIADMSALTVDELETEISKREQIVSQGNKQIASNNKLLNTNKNLRLSYAEQVEYINSAKGMVNDLHGSFVEIMEVLGEDGGPAAAFAEMGVSITNSIMDCLALQLQLKAAEDAAKGFGAAMNTAMSVIGWIVMAVQLVATVLKAVFAAKDNRLQKEIDKITERVEVLDKQLTKIESKLDKAFSAAHLAGYTTAAQRNIDAQIDAYNRMITLEKKKKKSDEEQIKQWSDTLAELEEARKEIYEKGFSTSSASIFDDSLSAAEAFVDAWHEAFASTGDGLSGLEGEFNEMMVNLVKRQAALQIVGSYMEKYKDSLKRYLDPEKGDVTLTAHEATLWAEEINKTFPELNEALTAFYQNMDGVIQTQGELSELGKGIQGVSETTAQALEALLNSIRFYVADSNAALRRIDVYFSGGDTIDNPMLSELQAQTALIRSIENMFGSVIGHGSSAHSGAYLKVLM